jgi:hypothetical protein
MTVGASTIDIVNVVISACIPIAIFAAGAHLAQQARAYEADQWKRRKRYDTRLERWQEISKPLNDLLCFFMLFGHFREVTPPEVIKRKRQLDRAVYANQHIFGEAFLETYSKFMALCFQTWAAVAEDAKIRASADLQRLERGSGWHDSWTRLFVAEEDASRRTDIEAAYNDLLRSYDEL